MRLMPFDDWEVIFDHSPNSIVRTGTLNRSTGSCPCSTHPLRRERAEQIFTKCERLRARSRHPARVLSGGERRLLEILRALVVQPEVLLVDEPSIGLEPRFIDMVFEILRDLQVNEGKTIVMVEQNAKRGLEFADVGYVLVSGELVMAAPGRELLDDFEVARLFLGG